MDPRQVFRGSMGSFCALVTLALAAPACGPSEPASTDASTEPAVETTQQTLSGQTPSKFTLFESGQVRPLALSPDKRHLFAVNTPDNRLEVFEVKPNLLVRKASIPVGLEPVAVAARTNEEVWVVNHLSDSVSIIKLDDGLRDRGGSSGRCSSATSRGTSCSRGRSGGARSSRRRTAASTSRSILRSRSPASDARTCGCSMRPRSARASAARR